MLNLVVKILSTPALIDLIFTVADILVKRTDNKIDDEAAEIIKKTIKEKIK